MSKDPIFSDEEYRKKKQAAMDEIELRFGIQKCVVGKSESWSEYPKRMLKIKSYWREREDAKANAYKETEAYKNTLEYASGEFGRAVQDLWYEVWHNHRKGLSLVVLFPWSFFAGYALYEVLHPEEITPEPIPIQQEVQPEAYIIPDPCGLEVIGGCEESVESIVRRYAIDAGIDPETAIRIANCESSMNPFARNEQSGAQGLFQFLPSTWEWIGSPGDPYNPYDNARAFANWYPSHPEWWVCK